MTVQETAATPHSHTGRAQRPTRATRATSYDVADFEVPGGREEEWRFTPLERIRGLHDGSVTVSGSLSVEVDPAPEVQVETVGRADPRIGRGGIPGDRVSAQAWSSFDRATVITVPREAQTSRATIVRVEGRGATGFGHLVVDVGPMAKAVVVVDHAGSAVYADNIELLVGEGAELTLVAMQDWADDAVHVSAHHARLAKDARLRSVVVSLGGSLVRISPTVTYSGSGADAELLGLYFADSGQHLEHRLFVDHELPHCRSNVVYKGALQGDGAHTIWIGDVLIRAAAEGTDTFELNRNLVLTEGARADSVPNLEIETGEIVGAGHASATGRFDDEQLFYLQARGITAEEARRLVVRGFFAELIARIGVPEVETRLLEAVEAELKETLA
jgi:Fe-S cluster assembly protein SufD